VRVLAEFGADDRFHVLRPTESRRIDHTLHSAVPARATSSCTPPISRCSAPSIGAVSGSCVIQRPPVVRYYFYLVYAQMFKVGFSTRSALFVNLLEPDPPVNRQAILGNADSGNYSFTRVVWIFERRRASYTYTETQS
jgi:hypothetical protein